MREGPTRTIAAAAVLVASFFLHAATNTASGTEQSAAAAAVRTPRAGAGANAAGDDEIALPLYWQSVARIIARVIRDVQRYTHVVKLS